MDHLARLSKTLCIELSLYLPFMQAPSHLPAFTSQNSQLLH